ncbi:maltose phosphorylase [Enterococcus sp. PF1-24]|uniref:glycoside hydrolase family 65 protein n=1 Tax=unclassified Enterococcus TaxID=2608891 RepID=UPI0024766855|nr:MULTISPECIES: glycosyl hydrolase family 65 protein [unclassified Enterococcus]MDH6364002.1 maltose phosphorylase [Enterococcus sp. PFB1-1]MDH6401103.1 maltose phosphorylase [Enterococcus sp. PF1-24]
MAKIADQYFVLDPWKIIEDGFDPSYSQVAESIFSLGNEYMGVRGYFEEGTTSESLLGSYFNGIYENTKSTYTGYKGVVTEPHFMVNAVDWLYTRLSIEGEQLDINVSTIEKFRRELDLKTGVLTRSFTWILASGKRIKISMQRFLHMERAEYGYQVIQLVPENFSGVISATLGLDFNTIHAGRDVAYWQEQKKGFTEQGASILSQTISSEQRVYSGFELEINQDVVMNKLEQPQFIGYEMTLNLSEGQETTVKKMVTNVVEKKITESVESLWSRGEKVLALQKGLGYEKALLEQKTFWDYVWANFDIQIEGDDKNQQGIRYCIFQLQQTYHGQDPTNNIGAKGLTGEAYGGHAFWDTETCCLPYYLFNNPKAARNLLEFRYNTLEQAKVRARDLDCPGACYPIATLNGKEACDLWQHASTQFQPSTGVAYGIWHYVHLTEDKEFLYGHGAEMLIEISRFLAARGDWSPEGDFGFFGVMGPDEFQVMVNHNGYTNYMAQQTFDYTVEVLCELQRLAPTMYDLLQEKTGVSDDELNNWQKCSEKTVILQEKTGLFEQHDGYFKLPHIDIHSIPVEEFPLYNHWSYDRIYRNDMIKQPDVLMFQFLYNQRFTSEEKRVNYEFYEPRTIHESSLSPSIHSILAAEIGRHEEAFDFFGFATRMDLDNYNRNTNEGLHTTSIAAAWVNIVYGFGGLRSDGPMLLFNPSIPQSWDSYTFRVEYKQAVIEIKVTSEKVAFQVVNNHSVEITIYDQVYEIGTDIFTLTIPEKWRTE